MKITKDIIAQVKAIDFVSFLERTEGFTFKKVGRYFQCKEHSSLNLVIGEDGLNYYTWHSQSQKGDIIEYVQNNILSRRDFISAVKYLARWNGNFDTSENKKLEVQQQLKYSSTNTLSISYDQKINRAIAYLCKSRGISYETINIFVKEGLIAQDSKGNIVFRHLDFSNQCVGAELKGTNTYKKFAGTAKGSNVAYGFSYCIGQPKKIYLFEAEVDLLSFYDMYSHKLSDCLLLSTSGVNKYMKIVTYLDKYNINKIIYCMDNDEVGNQTLKVIEGVFNNLIVVDGRGILLQNNVKDYNELLLNR